MRVLASKQHQVIKKVDGFFVCSFHQPIDIEMCER